MNRSIPESFSFPDLRGRTLLITGITSGIGRAFLPHLLKQGLKVIAVSKDEGQIDVIREEVGTNAENFHYFECDLADPTAVKTTAERLKNSGLAIDGILHNAAIDPRQWFEKSEEIFWQEVMQVNLFSAVTLTRHLLPILRRSDQGRIVFTGSVLAELGGACRTAYDTSKGAIATLTRALAHELRGSNITVNCLIPGAVVVEKELRGLDEKIISWQSIPRRLEPRDLIAPLCLLLSEWGGGISGQALTVDGGILHPLASPEIQGRDL
jgi:NAD(P)-dependent dehydrogenase (short-subunit alcohol dehydrogenase family)